MSTRKSLGFAFIDRYASLAIAIVSTMVLARLLTPADMGAYAVTMALLAVAATVRDMGAGQYLLQEKELTADRIRAVWAIQLSVGVGLAIIVALCSVPMAAFYGEPAMRDMLLVLALNYLINPLGSITYAWLMREMRYDAVAIMRGSSTATGALVSVWLAYRGHGAISLAWGSVCATAVNAAMSTLFRPSHYPWLPGTREIRRVLSFGTRVTSSSIISTVASVLPEFLLGKLQGLAAAGLYSRANGLVGLFSRLIIDAIASVALSLFARESRNAQNSSESLLRAISYTTALGGAFAVGLVFLAHPVVRVLYGSQWDASVDPVRLLACAAIPAAIVPLCSVALLGRGAVKLVLTTTAASAALSVVLTAFGAWRGINALALAALLAAFLTSIVWLRAAHSIVGFAWNELFKELARCTVVTVASGAGPALSFVVYGAQPEHYVLPLLLGIGGAAGGFLIGLRIAGHPLLEEFDRMMAMVRPKLTWGGTRR